MRRFWKQDSETADLEARLRSDRPAPDDDFVSRVAADVPELKAKPRRQTRMRLGPALGLTGAALTAAVILGGTPSPINTIRDGIEQAASKNAESNKPAKSQYEEKVTICHRARKGEKGVTITVSSQGAANHLQNHPDDTSGPCPGDTPKH